MVTRVLYKYKRTLSLIKDLPWGQAERCHRTLQTLKLSEPTRQRRVYRSCHAKAVICSWSIQEARTDRDSVDLSDGKRGPNNVVRRSRQKGLSKCQTSQQKITFIAARRCLALLMPCKVSSAERYPATGAVTKPRGHILVDTFRASVIYIHTAT